MSGRAARNTVFKNSEIEKIEQHFNIDLSSILINNNSLKRHYLNELVLNRQECAQRINFIKTKNNLSNLQMAVLLNISENALNDILQGKALPDLNMLNNMKQNFEVSLDWILYGK